MNITISDLTLFNLIKSGNINHGFFLKYNEYLSLANDGNDKVYFPYFRFYTETRVSPPSLSSGLGITKNIYIGRNMSISVEIYICYL